MTEQQFKVKAAENLKRMINCMANKEFPKLPAITNIEGSWCKDGDDQGFGVYNPKSKGNPLTCGLSYSNLTFYWPS